jgi:hypothetical protein
MQFGEKHDRENHGQEGRDRHHAWKGDRVGLGERRIGVQVDNRLLYRLERSTFFKALLLVLKDPERRCLRCPQRGPEVIRLLADPTCGMINLRSGNNNPRKISGPEEMAHAEAVILGDAQPDRRWLPAAQNLVAGVAG